METDQPYPKSVENQRESNDSSHPDYAANTPQTPMSRPSYEVSSRQSSGMIPPGQGRDPRIVEPCDGKFKAPRAEADEKEKEYDWNGSWIWEIGAAVLSMVGFALLIGFLIKIHNTPYATWQYTVSPNTVVSIIVTITKAALLLPVSSCLSQLKWNQYYRATPLYHMQAIDQASRGPWGSIEVVWDRIRGYRMSPMIVTGALITILTVAIDPFAQQLLAFPLRTVPAMDETAWIQNTNQLYAENGYMEYFGKTDIYFSHDNKWLPPSTLSSIMSGLAQTNSFLEPHCGSGNCSYPGFVTLGICSHCEDVTNRTIQRCQVRAMPNSPANAIEDTHINCAYTSPNGLSINLTTDDLGLRKFLGHHMVYFVDYWVSRLRAGMMFDIKAPIVSFLAASQSIELHYTQENATVPPPKPSLTECTIYYCEKEYLASSFSSKDTLGSFPHILRTQQLVPDNHGHTGPVEHQQLLPQNGSKTLSKNSSYMVSPDIFRPLRNVLSDMFNATFLLHDDGSQPGSLSLITLLRNGDLGELLDTMSTSVTDTFRANPRGNQIAGEAYRNESFIDVRWPWIILPAIVISGSVLLLMGTARASKRHQSVLWKSAVLPLLMSRLDAHHENEIASLRNVDKVQRMSKKVEVIMDQNERPLVFSER